ncbi:hypothetical protein L7F22_041189 [Adiantum nelumboides]|nr:hypothetical protein [Adiantum nelumboides]
MMEQRQRENLGIRMKRDFDHGRRDLEAALSDASANSLRRRIAERAQRRAHRSERSRREDEDLTDARKKYRLGRDGLTRVKHEYHKQRMTKIESDTDNGTEKSDHSRWKMGTGRASRRKEKLLGYRSRTLDGHYKKDRCPDLKIACPTFRGKKHDDLDVHIQAFEQYAELKHILEEEWGEYFPHTLKEAARKWYYHYSASKLQAYKKLKKAFILEYLDDRGDEDILCELNMIKQGKLSVRKYVQKIKELTRRLNEPPSEKRMRAWFLNGFNDRKLREQEVLAPTKKLTKLVHRALKLEQLAKKEKSRHRGRFDTSTTETTEMDKSSSSSSKSSKDDRKKKKKDSWSKKIDDMSRRIFEISGLRGPAGKIEKWCTKCKAENHTTEECTQCNYCKAFEHEWTNCKIRIHHLKEGKDLSMITFSSMEPVAAITKQPMPASTNKPIKVDIMVEVEVVMAMLTLRGISTVTNVANMGTL